MSVAGGAAIYCHVSHVFGCTRWDFLAPIHDFHKTDENPGYNESHFSRIVQHRVSV